MMDYNYNLGTGTGTAGVGILCLPPINSPLTTKVQVTDTRRKQIYKKVKPEDDDTNELLLTENVVVPVNNKAFDAMAIQFNDDDDDDDDSSITSSNIEEILETPPRTPHGNTASSPIKILVTSTDSEPVLLRNNSKDIKASDDASTSSSSNLIGIHSNNTGNVNGSDSNILDEIIDMMFETDEPVVCKKARMDFKESSSELGKGSTSSNTSSIVEESKQEEIEIEPNIGQIMEDMANTYFNQPEGHEMNFENEPLFSEYSLDGFKKSNNESENDDIAITWSSYDDKNSEADNSCGDQEVEEETNIYNTPPPTNPSSPPEFLDSPESSSCSTSSFTSNPITILNHPITASLKSPSFHSFGTSFFEELEEIRKQQSTDSNKPKEVMDIFNLESEDIISTILESEELIDSEQLKKGLINTASNVCSDNDDTMDLDLNEQEPSIQDIMKADCMWSSMKLQKNRSISCSSTESETNPQVLNERSIDMSNNGINYINNSNCSKLIITQEVKNKIIKSKNEELDYLKTITSLDHPYSLLQSVESVEFEGDKDDTQCMLNLNDDILMDENEDVNEDEPMSISGGETEDEEDDNDDNEDNDDGEAEDEDDESGTNEISISGQKLKELLFGGGDSQEVTINQTYDGKTKSARLVIQSKNALIQQMLSNANGRKTKILVPLKDLCSTLEHKNFQVTPIGPGKKIIKLTGSGETVANVLHNVVNSSNGNLLNKISIIECKSSATKNKPETTTRSSSNATSAEILNLFSESCTNNSSLNDKKSKYVTLTTTTNGTCKEKGVKSFIIKNNSPIKKQTQKEKIAAAVTAAIAASNKKNNPPPPAKVLMHHNNSERLRRSDLRNSFEHLKGMIPIIAKSKAPKVEILRRAEEYIRSLNDEDAEFTAEMNEEKQRSEMLKQKMMKLSNAK